jgi:SAM-dependent methyltransferase
MTPREIATLPLPPQEFQALVCGPRDTNEFLPVAWILTHVLAREGMLEPGLDFLDIGCGCGRIARQLTGQPIGSYIGFDRHQGMVEWSQREIGARDPRFRFDFFELKSLYTAWDAQEGSVDAVNFRFPYPAAAFDVVLLASVFTHMLPIEVHHYLGELARVLRPGGKALCSIFFSSGAMEIRDEINVFHEPRQFLTDPGLLSFEVRRTTLEATSGDEVDQSPGSSRPYEHNWYVLTRTR